MSAKDLCKDYGLTDTLLGNLKNTGISIFEFDTLAYQIKIDFVNKVIHTKDKETGKIIIKEPLPRLRTFNKEIIVEDQELRERLEADAISPKWLYTLAHSKISRAYILGDCDYYFDINRKEDTVDIDIKVRYEIGNVVYTSQYVVSIENDVCKALEILA